MTTVRPPGFRDVMIAVTAAVAAAMFLFYPLVFDGRVIAFGDNVSFWAPGAAFWTSQVRQGVLPLWNPCILGGVPFAADINHGLFYPPHWLALVLGTASTTGFLTVLHAALGIVGMYLLLNGLGLSRTAALWGGIIFALSEPFISLASHIVMLESMSYAPLVLYLVMRLTDGVGVRTAIALGLVVALSAVAGDIHATYIIAVGAATVLAVRCVQCVVGRQARMAGRALGLAALAGAAAALVAAVAIVPALELAQLTVRGGQDVSYGSYHSLDLKATLGMLLPGFWGTVGAGTVWSFRWGNVAYVGLIILFLAAYGARRPARGAVGIALVVVGAGLSFGSQSPLWRLAHAGLPGFAMFRQPREYFIIALIGAIILAAQGLADIGAWTPPKKSPRGNTRIIAALVFAGAAVSFAFLAVYNAVTNDIPAKLGPWWSGLPPEVPKWMAMSVAQALVAAGAAASVIVLCRSGVVRAKTAAWAVGIVVAADYALLAGASLVFGPPELYDAKPNEALAKAIQDPHARFVPESKGFGEYFEEFASRNTITPRRDDPGFTTLMKVKESLADDEAAYLGAASALGYSTFVPARYAALYEAATGRRPSPVRLRAVEGANYALLGANIVERVGSRWDYLGTGGVPLGRRVWVVHDWRPAKDFAEAREVVGADPAAALSRPVIEGAPQPPAHVASTAAGVLHWSRAANSMTLDASSSAPGMLIAAECCYPGWEALLDGKPVPIYAANLAFRAVSLPRGRHRVDFRFRPRSLAVGAGVTLVSLALIVATLVLAPRRKEQ